MMEFTFNGIVRHGFGFYNPNHAAALICSAFPFLWEWKKYAAAGWIASCLLTIPLAMTYSRTGVLVLGLELAMYFISAEHKNRKRAAAITPVMLLIFCLSGISGRFTLDKAIGNRLEIWFAGLKLYAANPHGAGIGNSGLAVSNFMLEDIQCRTLVNSHLTLLAELGIFAGFLWFAVIAYAICRGTGKQRACIAFSGLVFSAACSSVFDIDLLSDFNDFGGLTPLNFILSWILLALFSGLAVYLSWGKVQIRKLCASSAIAVLAAALPLFFRSSSVPQIKNGCAVRQGNEQTLVLYSKDWSIKNILPYLKDGFILPLSPGRTDMKNYRIMLFGNAAEYARFFPESEIVFINPPEFFNFPPNTKKVFFPEYREILENRNTNGN